MLTIAINLYVDVVSVSEGVFMTCLNCSANAEIAWEVEYIEVIFAAYP